MIQGTECNWMKFLVELKKIWDNFDAFKNIFREAF